MDIKSLGKNLLPFDVQKAEKNQPKTDASSDRDGNGQMPSQEQETRRNLSAEELQEAIKYLESLPGVKENNLVVRLETKDGVSVVLVEDANGKVVRRIPEAELSLLTKSRAKASGNLLNKAL